MKPKKEEMTERRMKAFLATQNPPSALRAAGWTPSDLLAAGWTPSDLLAAVWTPSALRAAGWTPSALRAAGWTPSDLRAAGWTPSDLRAAGWTPSDLRAAGWTPSALLAAGWTPSDLLAAVWTPSDLRAAGWTPSALRAAGWTPSALRAAGWTPSDLLAAEKEWEAIPILEKPYTKLLTDIKAKKRIHDQGTFGPEDRPVEEANVCGTRMCTAGHLVQMAGKVGWELMEKYGWKDAAALIHRKNRPDVEPQNFWSIPQEFAMAYIEERAAEEEAKS